MDIILQDHKKEIIHVVQSDNSIKTINVLYTYNSNNRNLKRMKKQ